MKKETIVNILVTANFIVGIFGLGMIVYILCKGLY